ncbi:MAG: hypothetical protein ABWY26_13320 [Microbacterium sp.]
MGQLFYGDTTRPIDIPDRLLAHLKVVVATKLRRSESFTLSWSHHDDEPKGRSTIWLHSSIPLRFVFDSPDPEELDPALLQEMARAANSSGGLTLSRELLAVPEADVPRAA